MGNLDREIRGFHYATREPILLRWQDGLITHVEPIDSSASPDVWLAPSLFDLQVNGYGGVDFQQDQVTVDNLLSAVRALGAAGCRRFLLTLITDEWEKLTSRLRHFRHLRSESVELQKAIVGWHVEGPFLSNEPGFYGAHNRALTCNPTVEHLLELRTITGNDPLLVTLAPERPGALAATEFAASHGIRISLGHTNATAEILAQAVRAGATSFTHLGNGCPRELDRHDNILWRVLETPGLTVSLIPDRIHVSPPLFRLLHRLLPSDSVFYVSDAMAAAGMPPGKYTLGKLQLEVGKDHVVRQPGKALFAGSALPPFEGVVRSAEMLRCPWQETWRRFSETPAKLLGLRNELAVGQPADFCALHVGRPNQLLRLASVIQDD
jgi:N-acetylglucosamine-6-phosphate deacetylase